MRILGAVGTPRGLNFDALDAPLVTARVHLYGEGISRLIEFVIDTGASATVLNPRQAAAVWPRYLEHDFGADTSLQDGLGVGGATGYVLRSASLSLTGERGEVETFDTDVHIARPVFPDPARGQPGNLEFPALLGRDVLRRFRLTLAIEEGLVALER